MIRTATVALVVMGSGAEVPVLGQHEEEAALVPEEKENTVSRSLLSGQYEANADGKKEDEDAGRDNQRRLQDATGQMQGQGDAAKKLGDTLFGWCPGSRRR